MKKYIFLFTVFQLFSLGVFAQEDQKDRQAIIALIEDYAKARELQDTILLKKILMPNIDQLVSSGEWRMGIQSAVEGMQRSSIANQGKRTLTVDKIKFITDDVSIVDAKYVIENTNGIKREMWSTFLVVFTDKGWKISAIRNMLPAK